MSRYVAALATLVALMGAAPAAPASAQPSETALTLVAGAGGAGFSGDDGPATAAGLNRPMAAAVAGDGTVYVADMVNRRVRAVGPDGIIRTVAGDGGPAAPAGRLPAGTRGPDISLGSPNTIALGTDGTLFIADSTASRVYALAADGTITVRVDPAVLGGPIDSITALAVAADGTLYLADRENNRIVEIPAGTGSRPVSTPVPLPAGLATDSTGDVWVSSASAQLSRLREGRLATIVSPPDGGWTADENRPNATPFNATAVSAGADGVYLVDNGRREVRRLGPDGSVSTVAALPADPFGTRDPVSLAAGATPAGPLYLIDTVGNRIFSAPVAATADTGDDPGNASVWLWILGAAGLAVVLTVLLLSVRR